jgi:hypothetical protein
VDLITTICSLAFGRSFRPSDPDVRWRLRLRCCKARLSCDEAGSFGRHQAQSDAAATATTGGPYLDVLYDRQGRTSRSVALADGLSCEGIRSKEAGAAIDYKATATTKKARTLLPA